MLIEPLNNKYRRARPKKLFEILKAKDWKKTMNNLFIFVSLTTICSLVKSSKSFDIFLSIKKNRLFFKPDEITCQAFKTVYLADTCNVVRSYNQSNYLKLECKKYCAVGCKLWEVELIKINNMLFVVSFVPTSTLMELNIRRTP